MTGIVFEALPSPAFLTAVAPPARFAGHCNVGSAAVMTARAAPAVFAGESLTPTVMTAVAPPAVCRMTSGAATVMRAIAPAAVFEGDASDAPSVDLTIMVAFAGAASATFGVSHIRREAMDITALGAVCSMVSGAQTVMAARAPAATFSGVSVAPLRGWGAGFIEPNYWWMTVGPGAQTSSVSARSSLALNDGPDPELIHLITEHLILSGAFDSLLERLVTARSTIVLSDVVRSIIVLHLSDTVVLGDGSTVSPEIAVDLIDTLMLAGNGTAFEEINALVSSVLALMDAGASLHEALAQSSLSLGDAVALQARAYAKAIAELRLSAAPTWSVVLVALAHDTLTLSDDTVSFNELAALVRSGIALLAHVNLADDPFIAWVLGTESRAAFTYDQWPFNSYAQFGGRHLAAGPDGIYVLGGDSDDGAPIVARISTGLMDMGTSARKRIEAMYLGLSAEGELGLRVVTTMPNGEKQAHDYRMRLRPAGAATTNRIKIGRGLASRYWSFEISNPDGGQFTLSDSELLPMVLDRRV